MPELALALIAFVGSHELLSHLLRKPLVARIGEAGFAVLYSVVAAGTLYWAVMAWQRAAPELVWVAPTWVWSLGSVVMLVASILFVGSVTAPNPALPGRGAAASAARYIAMSPAVEASVPLRGSPPPSAACRALASTPSTRYPFFR